MNAFLNDALFHKIISTSIWEAKKIISDPELNTHIAGVISILDPRTNSYPEYDSFQGKKLQLRFEDFAANKVSISPPNSKHILSIINWITENNLFVVPDDKFILIHCTCGVSRSPTVQYIIRCIQAGHKHEMTAVKRLKLQSPNCIPNKLLISLADHILNRSGSMIKHAELITVKTD